MLRGCLLYDYQVYFVCIEPVLVTFSNAFYHIISRENKRKAISKRWLESNGRKWLGKKLKRGRNIEETILEHEYN
jgi:hypothetical protein